MPDTAPPQNFYRAVGSPNLVEVQAANWNVYSANYQFSSTAIRPSTSGGSDGTNQGISITLYGPMPTNGLTVYYSVTGTATNGVDYAYLPGSVTIYPPSDSATVTIQPYWRATNGFDPIAILTVLPRTNYVVDPNNAVSVPIMDHFRTNPVPVVVSNVNQIVCVDYHAPSNSLLLSVNYSSGYPTNFGLLTSNATFAYWSGVSDVGNEVNMATVKATTSGFFAGETFFTAAASGIVGWVKADGSLFNDSWLVLTNQADSGNSDVYVDRTGNFGNNLLVERNRANESLGDIFVVDAATNATLLATLPSQYLEGMLTLPNSTNYGPFAGMLLAGEELTNTLFTVTPAGAVQTWNIGVPGLGVTGQTLLIIPTNQTFYCQDTFSPGPNSYVRELSADFLRPHVGDILVLMCSEESTALNPQAIWILHWNGASFDAWCLLFTDIDDLGFQPSFYYVERGAFAPFYIPLP